MVGAGTSEARDLLKLGKMLREALRSKSGTIVGQILLGNHASVAAHQLKGFLCKEGVFRRQMLLKLNMDISSSMVDEETATSKQIGLLGLAAR